MEIYVITVCAVLQMTADPSFSIYITYAFLDWVAQNFPVGDESVPL